MWGYGYDAMEYEDALELLDSKKRYKDQYKIKRETWLRRMPDRIALEYHGHEIVTYYPDGRIVLDTCGWPTVTTKERLAHAIKGWHIASDNGVWVMWKGRWHVPYNFVFFVDGIEIMPDGSLRGAIETPWFSQSHYELLKTLKRYASRLHSAHRAGNYYIGSNWTCPVCDESEPDSDLHSIFLHQEEDVTCPHMVEEMVSRGSELSSIIDNNPVRTSIDIVRTALEREGAVLHDRGGHWR